MQLVQPINTEPKRGPVRGARTGRRAGILLPPLMCAGTALFASGCALTFPIASLTSDRSETGSIERQAGSLSSDLDGEDWRRAKAALAVALDPQGNGALATWANPATGAKGSFAAAAQPQPDGDRICRAFNARVSTSGRPERLVNGSACRGGDGDWSVAKVAGGKPTALADPAGNAHIRA